MHKSLIPAALLGALLPAQRTDAVKVPGTDTQVRTESVGGELRSSVSRDAGRTWTRQNEIDRKVHMRFGTFDPKNPPLVPAALQAAGDSRLFLVQFETQIISEFRAALQGMGAEITYYVPSQSYLVRMDRALWGKVGALPFVRSATEYHTAYKLEPAIIADLGKNPGAQTRYTIVFVDERRDVFGLQARCIALGGKLEVPGDGGILFEATLTEAQMLALANDDRTLWIQRSSKPEFDIDNARIQGGTNYVDSVAGIRGIGMTGHIMEGIYATHTEFAAISGVRSAPIAPYSSTGQSHGTNTAGEIYARGASSLYKGLMPNAQLVYTNYNYVYGNNNRYSVTAGVIKNQRVMLDTASWGYARTLVYDARSAEMDNIIFNLDLFVTQSQSNAGSTSQPRNSRPQAWAKNICSAGGFYHRNNSSPTDDYWGRSGSTGPASDGRIGVTLSAYYDSIRTTSGTSGYTTGFGGTSGATPIINGLGGNMIEMFTDGLFGYAKTKAKTSTERSKVLPHFTTTKALLVATANQLTYNSSGTTTGANRYQQGWGFPDLKRAYDERDLMLVIDELDVLAQGKSRTYWVFAAGGRLNVAMQYADPQAGSPYTIHRINSVDLRVKTSKGTSYWGNHGLLTGPTSTSGGSANDRDTEECVILSNAPAGLTEITVSASAVRTDGHLETSATDVDYALVAQGLKGLRDTSGLKLAVASAAKGNLTVGLTNLPGGWTHGFTLFSLAATRPMSTGNFLGLEFDGLSLSLLALPASAGNVFHFTSTGSGSQYPNATYQFPAAVANAVSGVTLDAVACLLNSSGAMTAASNVARVSVK